MAMATDPSSVAAPDDARCVRFLAALACRAPDAMLCEEWARLGELQGSRLPALASRFGVSSALLELLARAMPDSPHTMRIAASALVSSQPGDQAMSLLGRMMDDPAVRETAPVVVKGAALRILGLEGDERAFVDVDIVLDSSRLDVWHRAAEAIGAGWEAASGYESAHVSSGMGMIEIHGALPGFFGNEPGPAAVDLVSFRVETSWPGLFALGGQPAREVCVQHFVFHHDGEPLHALRALQDLAALEGAGEGTGLDWGDRGESVRRATSRLRTLACAFRDGARTDELDRFVEALASVAVLDDPIDGFSREIDRWIDGRAASGGSRARLVVRRMFPPLGEMRRSEGEPMPVTLMRYLWRPPALAYRYLRDRFALRRDRATRQRIEEWQSLLRG